MSINSETPFFFKKENPPRRRNLIIIQLIRKIYEQLDGYQEEVITSLERAELGRRSGNANRAQLGRTGRGPGRGRRRSRPRPRRRSLEVESRRRSRGGPQHLPRPRPSPRHRRGVRPPRLVPTPRPACELDSKSSLRTGLLFLS